MCGAGGGNRTHTSLRKADFKSAASTVPPRPLAGWLSTPRRAGAPLAEIETLIRRHWASVPGLPRAGQFRTAQGGQETSPRTVWHTTDVLGARWLKHGRVSSGLQGRVSGRGPCAFS